MFPPSKIKIVSDSNELTFVEKLKQIGSKEICFKYIYTKSKTKKGSHLILTESDLIKLITNNSL